MKSRIQFFESDRHGFMHREPAYWCPVCKAPHPINTTEPGRPKWAWNGSVDAPTFTPSVLMFYTRPAEGTEFFKLKRGGKKRAEEYATQAAAQTVADALAAQGDPGWVPVPRQRESKPAERVTLCHAWIRDGNIEILPDTPGGLGGHTLPLEEWEIEEWGRD
jgi:hypothetical protein